ncbi:MAG: TadE family protein, partial [Candidatus Limnocylindrales bacterium]
MSNPKPGPSGRRSTRKRGQALVEFAMVIPIFLLVLSGICDFGFMLYSRMSVINAAREG